MIKRNVRKLKVPDLLTLVRSAVLEDRYRFSAHALLRMTERKVTIPEVVHVLETGHHEKSKDTYDSLHGDWNYCVVGQTVDGRRLRVVVALDPTSMLVVTVIVLGA